MTGSEKCSLFVATRRLGVVRHTPAAYIKLHGNGIYQLRICPRCAIWGQKPSRFKDPQLVNPKFYYVLACSLSVTVATAHTHRQSVRPRCNFFVYQSYRPTLCSEQTPTHSFFYISMSDG